MTYGPALLRRVSVCAPYCGLLRLIIAYMPLSFNLDYLPLPLCYNTPHTFFPTSCNILIIQLFYAPCVVRMLCAHGRYAFDESLDGTRAKQDLLTPASDRPGSRGEEGAGPDLVPWRCLRGCFWWFEGLTLVVTGELR